MPGPGLGLRAQLPPLLQVLQLAHLRLRPVRHRGHDVRRLPALLRGGHPPLPQPRLRPQPLLPNQEADQLGLHQPGSTIPPGLENRAVADRVCGYIFEFAAYLCTVGWAILRVKWTVLQLFLRSERFASFSDPPTEKWVVKSFLGRVPKNTDIT